MINISLVLIVVMVMAISPRMFMLVTVILGSVIISKFEFVLGVKDPEGNMLRNIATNVGGGLLVFRGILIGRRIKVPPALWPYVILVGLSMSGLFFAIDLKEGMRFISVLTIPLLVFLVAALYFQKRDYLWTFRGMIIVCFVQIVVGMIEYAIEPGIRVSGLHDASSVYGWFICNVIMIATYLSKSQRKRAGTVGLLILVGAVMIVLTGARVALLIFPVALFFFVKEYPTHRAMLALLAFFAIAIIGFTLLIQMEQGSSRVSVDVESSDVGFVGESGGTIAWRLLLWERLLSGWMEKPIFGYGPGGDYAVSLPGGLSADLNYADTGPLNTHNEYVKLLFNHGLMGLGLFILFLWRLITLKSKYASPQTQNIAGLVGYIASTWLLLSFTDNGLSYHGQTSIIFLCLAFLENTSTSLEKEAEPPHKYINTASV